MSESPRDQFDDVARSHFAVAEGEDSYAADHARDIAQAFRDHFAQQTCANCRFWDVTAITKYKDCLLLSDDPTLDGTRPAMIHSDGKECEAVTIPFAGADGATFATAATFGCKLFTAKDR